MNEANYSAVVDSIYDAALDASRWPVALQEIADLLAGGPAAVLFQDQLTKLGTGATIRLDPAALALYYKEFGTRNPLTVENDLARFDPRRMQINTDEHILPKAELVATDYYNEFSRPNGMHSALMIAFGRHGPSVATLNIMRGVAAPQFGSSEIEIVRNLQPHLARAFQVAVRLGETTQGALVEMMERSPQGLFLVGAGGVVQRANRAGSALLGDGLSIVQRELAAASPEAARRLRQIIGQATARWTEERSGGALTLPRPSLQRPLSVVVIPLGRQAAEIFDVGPSALVCVSDPGAAIAPDKSLLLQLFDLSPTEIRVTDRLLLGESPEQVSLALGVKVSTTRWHLASIFRKTGTSRQADLVRLLLSLPQG